MGFGTLFFGYFIMFAFSLSETYFFADIIGALVVIYAFSKLAEYNRYFVRAMISALVFMLLCAVTAVSLMFRIYEPDGNIDMLIDIAKQVAGCIMHIFMFLGTLGISSGAAAEKLVDTTKRDFVMTMVYYGFSLIVLLCGNLLGDYVQSASMMVYLYWVVCLVLNLALIYRCFGILCPADEDENAPPKRSRFEFVNKFNDKFDEIEEKKQSYRKESMQLAMEEADRLANEKQNKQNNKGKRNKHKNKKKH